MKKLPRLLLLAICLLAAVTLTSCQKNEKLILGTWNIAAIESEGTSVPISMIGTFDVTFKDNNTCNLDIQFSALAQMFISEFLQDSVSNSDVSVGGVTNDMIRSILSSPQTIPGSYTIGEEDISITLFSQTLSGTINSLDKEELVCTENSSGHNVIYRLNKK